MTKRLLLIDGHSLAYRAFYALPVENFATVTGQPTNAIYGFTSMLINLIRDEKPTHIATAFDVSRKTFRSEKFPEYKANRSATPDTFRSQMGYLMEMVTAMGIQHFALEGFEADDIIATLTTRAEAEGFDVLICTGDRDSFQLVSQSTTVLYPKRGVTDLARMTPYEVESKYGLTPAQYPDFAALRGDPSDNLPSVPGVGEKTATKWIQDFGSLKNLVARIDEIPGKAGESVRSHVAEVLLNRELTQLERALTMDVQISDLQWNGADSAHVNQLLDLLEIKALKERVKPLLNQESQESSGQTPAAIPTASFERSASDIDSLLVGRTEPIALEIIISDGKIVEYAIALDENSNFIVRDSRVGNWFYEPSIPKIVHAGKELLRSFPCKGIVFDTELAAYLLNPGSRNLTLTDLTEKYLGIVNAEQPEDLFSSFTGSGAPAIYALANILSQELSRHSMNSLLGDLEIPVMIDLAEMESTGVEVDQEKLVGLASFFRGEVDRETQAAHASAGKPFNVGSPKQLQAILFDDLKLPKTKKIKTGYTTDADALAWLFEKTEHPLLKHLLRIRETSKLLTTIEGLLTAVARDGRIHTNFQQTVAATGRLSSTDPNLQNIPVRTEEGRRIRDCFIAGSEFENLLTADYSQIEMRIMAHLSHDELLTKAFASGEDLHSTVASEVFGVPASEVTPEMRRQIKAMSYGLAYGLSAYGLAAQLNLTPPEASSLLERYFQRFGGIRDYLQTVVEAARKVGYTETILGRRRYLPDLNAENRQRREIAERMALNAPIQGSAADVIKVAMINCRSAMRNQGLKSRLLLQVHDELIFEIAPGEEEVLTELVRREMGSAFSLSVPLAVNIGIGKSWDLAAH